ncbi:MAG: RNA polymerase sigma factor RpoD/SigA [Chitinophagales bacterium]|nr:RNA polymerase sigma factor RpoD/SigA [Chitinophagales bacterium]
MKQLKITTKITSRDSYSIDKYLNEIGRLPLLTEQQEVELASRIKNGDQEALEQLITANLRFVVSVAKQYQNQGLSLNDLINEGNIGLIKAASKFDETKGFKFISYAVWWIRQSILQALIEQPRIVRVPMNKATFYQKITKAVSDFEQKNQREPSTEELAEILAIRPDELIQLRSSLTFHVSTDSSVSDDDETTNLDLMEDANSLQPDRMLIDESLKTEMKIALQHLSDREMEILSYYYGLKTDGQSFSLDEIGDKMGLTRERVRQLKDKALRKIKKNSAGKGLRTYLS